MMLNTLEVRYCKGARDHLYILYIMLDDMIAMLMLNINYLAIPRNYDRRYLNIEVYISLIQRYMSECSAMLMCDHVVWVTSFGCQPYSLSY